MSQTFCISSYKPRKGEKFFVDTNVWFWTTYAASKTFEMTRKPEHYQLSDYPAFLQRALNDGVSLCHCPLTLAELANTIENTELDIYRKNIGKPYFEKKEFRRIVEKRKAVLDEIEIAWKTICAMSTCIDVKLDNTFVEQGKALLNEGLIDPLDAYFIQTMRQHKIDYVVTDDHDFSTIRQLMLLTANQKALKNTN